MTTDRHNRGKKLLPPWQIVIFTVITALLLCTLPVLANDAVPADEPIIKSGCEYDYPPFCIVEEGGRANGFSVELLRAALQAINHKVAFRVGPWVEVKGLLEQGKIDVLPLVGRTPEREAIFDFTFPYLSLHGVIVVPEDTTDIHDLNDLKGRNVAVMAGDNAEEFLRRSDLGVEIHTTSTFEKALRELSEGRHDAVVIQRLLALRLMQQNGISNLRIVGKPLEGLRQDFCFAVKEGDKEALSLLNEGLALVMADGTFNRLQKKWFATLELPTNNHIIIGGDHNYPPYEFLDKFNRPAGYNVELTQALAEATGLDIEVRLGPWEKIRQGLANGEIDAIHGMFYSPERGMKFDFSPPHTVIAHVAVVRKGDSPPDSLADLKDKSIVVMQGDIMHEWLLQNGLETQITTVANQSIALRQLAKGQYDCALIARLPAMYWIDKFALENLSVSGRALLAPDYCYAVSRDRKELLATLAEGMKVLHESGEYHRIYAKWMGVYEDTPPDLMSILRYIAIVVGPLLLIISFFWSRTLRQQVNRRTTELRESEERFKGMFNNMSSGVAVYEVLDNGADFVFVDFNPAGEKIEQKTRGELIGKSVSEVFPGAEAFGLLEILRRVWQTGVPEHLPDSMYRDDRTQSWRESFIYKLPSGELVAIYDDISERKQAEQDRTTLETQLRHSQKMDAVGQLAGGVAHDFNNLLQVILGYGEITLENSRESDPTHMHVTKMMNAADRAKTLVGQLLAFSHRQVLDMKDVNLNRVVSDLMEMIQRVIGTNITLDIIADDNLGTVSADPGQLDQILMNLCVNAQDAMPTGGTITIKTGNVQIDADYCETHTWANPGSYALLSVTDTGCGMDDETITNAFEPFFTTKGVGKGTGLGLSMVYGLVTQHQGLIHIDSEIDKGTTFRIYLPLVERSAATVAHQAKASVSGGVETILIAEDEESVLELSRLLLEDAGYNVLTACDGEEAIRTCEKHAGEISLALLDVMMPKVDGFAVYEHIQKTQPVISVMFSSGYNIDAIHTNFILDEGLILLQKPFQRDELLQSVRTALDTSSK